MTNPRRRGNPVANAILIAASLGMLVAVFAMKDGGSGPGMSLAWGAAAFLAIGAGGTLYLLPSVLAFQRRMESRWILLLVNFWLGVSIIGWIGCFIWAMAAPEPDVARDDIRSA